MFVACQVAISQLVGGRCGAARHREMGLDYHALRPFDCVCAFPKRFHLPLRRIRARFANRGAAQEGGETKTAGAALPDTPQVAGTPGRNGKPGKTALYAVARGYVC